MTEEHRKFLRFECVVPVEDIRFQGLTGLSRRASLDDISREGLRLVMDADIAFNPGVELDFVISGLQDKTSVSIHGQVVWSKPHENKFEIGLKILEMDKAAKAELLEIGFERWKEKKKKKPLRSGSKG
jgi:c-di-GMP-binding flagellar brake protein YcgR